MGYRTILVPMLGIATDSTALHAALSVARRFEGHVVALFVRPAASDFIPVVSEAVSAAQIEEMLRISEQATEKRSAAAKHAFETLCAESDVPLADHPPGPDRVSAQWCETTGRPESVFPRRAILSDLVVFGGPSADAVPDPRATIEATLLAGGRPILLVPPELPDGIGHTVAIAWNGRVEAGRALAAAMPLIEAAGTVHLLTAETPRTSIEVGAEAADYLQWRGITAQRQPVEVADEPVGAALLRAATMVGADLLVMGGYGHGRLREYVLGGVSRHVLGHAHLPVLLAH